MAKGTSGLVKTGWLRSGVWCYSSTLDVLVVAISNVSTEGSPAALSSYAPGCLSSMTVRAFTEGSKLFLFPPVGPVL